MSRYRGPRFKKIRRLGALPGLTNNIPIKRSSLRNQSSSMKKSQYRIRLEEKQKLCFHMNVSFRKIVKLIRFLFRSQVSKLLKSHFCSGPIC